jgi:hypothetical protein
LLVRREIEVEGKGRRGEEGQENMQVGQVGTGAKSAWANRNRPAYRSGGVCGSKSQGKEESYE